MVRPILACAFCALVGCNSAGLPTSGKPGYATATSSHALQNGSSVDDAAAEATFPSRTARPTCASVIRVGRCAASSSCGAPPSGDTAPSPDTAGVITISGGLVPMVLRPDSWPTPYFFDQPGQRGWTGGETLTFAATGGSISPFAGQVSGPAIAIVNAPALSQNDPQSGLPLRTLTVDRSRDLSFRWGATSPATLSVAFSSSAMQGMWPVASLSCEFDATSGEGTIPSSLLAMLPAGQGVVAVGTFNSTVVSVGDWAITLGAQSGATAPDGSTFDFVTMLQ